MMQSFIARVAAVVACLMLAAGPALPAARIKDVASLQAGRENQLIGYGLVVGLQGTGDSMRSSPFTEQSMRAMLQNLGISMVGTQTRAKNIAAVLVTANLPPFASPGSRIDITVGSLGDASSLRGGTLVMTSLSGADGQIYAVAQGSVVVTGVSASGDAASVQQGVTTAGRVPNGAIIERELPSRFKDASDLVLQLRNPDFSTAVGMADAINRYAAAQYGSPIAESRDSQSVGIGRGEAQPPAGGDQREGRHQAGEQDRPAVVDDGDKGRQRQRPEGGENVEPRRPRPPVAPGLPQREPGRDDEIDRQHPLERDDGERRRPEQEQARRQQGEPLRVIGPALRERACGGEGVDEPHDAGAHHRKGEQRQHPFARPEQGRENPKPQRHQRAAKAAPHNRRHRNPQGAADAGGRRSRPSRRRGEPRARSPSTDEAGASSTLRRGGPPLRRRKRHAARADRPKARSRIATVRRARGNRRDTASRARRP